jgi:hypothetical protein
MDQPTAARLTVHRRSRDDEGERQLFVSLDGSRLGMLRFGRELTCEIAPGRHRLRVHNTFWWKTVDFEVHAGEHVHFSAINVVPSLMVAMAAALGTAPMFVKLVPYAPEAAAHAAGSSGGPAAR